MKGGYAGAGMAVTKLLRATAKAHGKEVEEELRRNGRGVRMRPAPRKAGAAALGLTRIKVP